MHLNCWTIFFLGQSFLSLKNFQGIWDDSLIQSPATRARGWPWPRRTFGRDEIGPKSQKTYWDASIASDKSPVDFWANMPTFYKDSWIFQLIRRMQLKATISIQKRISKKVLFSGSLVNKQSLVQPRESTDLTIIMGQGYTDMLKLRAKWVHLCKENLDQNQPKESLTPPLLSTWWLNHPFETYSSN